MLFFTVQAPFPVHVIFPVVTALLRDFFSLNHTIFSTSTLACRFDCYKNGTIGEVCNVQNGLCVCKNGFYGDSCDKGNIKLQFQYIY